MSIWLIVTMALGGSVAVALACLIGEIRAGYALRCARNHHDEF